MGSGQDWASLEDRKRGLLELLNETQKALSQTNGEAGAMDIHHPERSPGWKPYRHQDYPKMMFHPAKLDPQREAERKGVRRRNEANPNLAPLDIPAAKPLTTIVRNKEAEQEADKRGFVCKPPQLVQPEDVEQFSNDPLANPELVGADKLCGRGCGKAPHPGRCAGATKPGSEHPPA